MNTEGAAAAELALKAYSLRNPEMLHQFTDGDRVMRRIADSIDLTEAPEDAACSLVIDLMHYCDREKIDWNDDVLSRAQRVAITISFPKQSEIELPLLKLLHELGDKAQPKELYPKVAELFPQLTEEDLSARLPSSPSTYRWHNLVQWSRQKLVEKGEIDASTRGVWKLMPRGRARASGSAANATEELLLANQATLKDLVYENEAEVKRRIISELHELGATEFEQFCVSLLGPLGYQQLQVTNRGADRGIDGHGLFRQGVVTIRSAFQAKRWRNNPVSRPEIDKFRGAIQGDYDHGVFLTTGRFTSDAEAASIKKGAISLLLLDGEAIAESMIRTASA